MTDTVITKWQYTRSSDTVRCIITPQEFLGAL